MGPLFLKSIRFYQKTISPDHGFLARPARICRFYPSCSEYAANAFGKYSIPKAGWLTLRRVLRCQPFSIGGWDPVP
ncbi:MAG: membrane protein insertion efficiency factor YidD [Patescibacteria group bacterium]